jgi:hypothetical protein
LQWPSLLELAKTPTLKTQSTTRFRCSRPKLIAGALFLASSTTHTQGARKFTQFQASETKSSISIYRAPTSWTWTAPLSRRTGTPQSQLFPTLWTTSTVDSRSLNLIQVTKCSTWLACRSGTKKCINRSTGLHGKRWHRHRTSCSLVAYSPDTMHTTHSTMSSTHRV